MTTIVCHPYLYYSNNICRTDFGAEDMDTEADMDSSKTKVNMPFLLVLICSFHQIEKFLVKISYNVIIFCVQDEEDYDVMQDPEFLQSVLENLPGVDPNNEAIRNAMGSLASQTGSKPDAKKDEEKKKWTKTAT